MGKLFANIRAALSWSNRKAARMWSSLCARLNLIDAPTALPTTMKKDSSSTTEEDIKKVSPFKTKFVEDGIDDMHQTISAIMWEMIDYVKDRGHTPAITATFSTEELDKKLGRKSRTHREGRAFDLRTWDLPEDLVTLMMDHFNTKYGYMGAVSYFTRRPKLIVHHDVGTGAHLHVQVSPNYLEFSDEDKRT